jgi:hypothetical protein
MSFNFHDTKLSNSSFTAYHNMYMHVKYSDIRKHAYVDVVLYSKLSFQNPDLDSTNSIHSIFHPLRLTSSHAEKLFYITVSKFIQYCNNNKQPFSTRIYSPFSSMDQKSRHVGQIWPIQSAANHSKMTHKFCNDSTVAASPRSVSE